MTEVPLEAVLEGTLFAAGRGMTLGELAEGLGYPIEEIEDCLGALQATMRRRRYGALRIVEVGGRWALEVRHDLSEHLPSSTKPEIPPKVLKAAALIAYHQPMAQSRLIDLLGQKGYEYVRILARAGLIMRRRDGSTRRLTTTARFAEMFGCPHTDIKRVRAWFRDQAASFGLLEIEEEVPDALKELPDAHDLLDV